LHIAINSKLASVVEALPEPPAWHEMWSRLGPESTEQERLTVYQAIRDSGVLPDEAGFYLVSWQIDAIASLVAEEVLRDMDERLTAIQRKYGLEEGELWLPGEAPKEYEDLRREYQAAWDGIYAEKLVELGEQEMAEQFRTAPDEFERRSSIGQAYFHGARKSEDSDVPPWLDHLVETVAENMEAVNAMGPLGFRYGEEAGFWEVMLYPVPVELVGGAVDGEVVAPGFTLDLEGLRSAFEQINGFSWNSIGFHDGEGPYISIEGKFQGHHVYLQIMAYAPEDEEPGMKLDCSKGGG
jgi:hypothetical protein